MGLGCCTIWNLRRPRFGWNYPCFLSGIVPMLLFRQILDCQPRVADAGRNVFRLYA